MDAVVRPATPPGGGTSLDRSADHPFVVPGTDGGPTSEFLSQLNGQQDSPAGSSSTTTLPRLASVQLSHNDDLENSVPNRVRNQFADLDSAQPEADGARRSSGSFTGNVLRGDSIADQEVVVLTPSRLRLDSRVVMLHACFSWLANAFWAVAIWQKLEGRTQGNWWTVFFPTIFGHSMHIPVQLYVLTQAEHMVYKQIGPPPPPSASPGLVLQYAILRHVRVRSHRVDWANNVLESTALLVTKLLFCDALERGTLGDTPLRLMFTPIWACWVITFALLCLKDRTERMFGSSRDLLFIFLLFVAFRVDEKSTYSWRVVFLVPWMWFSGLLLVAVMVFLLLLFAKVWARPRELLLPIGFLCLLLSTIPQFVSYIALVWRLDGDESSSISSIMWPNALSWFLMWMSAWVIATALRQKEAVRDALLARGAVWTAHEAVARRLHAERDEAQRRVDELSEEEVARLVESMMAGKPKPGRLRRVGENLYKRIASLEPALADQAAQGAMASAPPSPSGSPSSPPANVPAAAAAAAAATGADAEVSGGPEASPGSGLRPAPQAAPAAASGSPAAAAAAGSEGSSLRPTGSVGGSGAAASPVAAANGGGSLGGLFRHNRVVPLARPTGGQAGGAASATAAAATAAAAAEAGGAGAAPGDAGLTGPGSPGPSGGSLGSTASGAVDAAAGTGTPSSSRATAATGAAATAAAAATGQGQGPAPSRLRSGRNTWLAGGAEAATGGLVELVSASLEEGRDTESGGGANGGGGAAPSRTRNSRSGQVAPAPADGPPAGALAEAGASLTPPLEPPAPRRLPPGGAAAAAGAVPAVAAAAGAPSPVVTAAAVAARNQRQNRPPPLPLRRPGSAVVPPVSGDSGSGGPAAAAGSGAAGSTAAQSPRTPARGGAGGTTRASETRAGATGVAAAAVAVANTPACTRPRSASTPAALAAAAASAGAPVGRGPPTARAAEAALQGGGGGGGAAAANPRQSPSLAEQPGASAVSSPRPDTAGTASAPSAAAAGPPSAAGAPATPSTSAMRSPAVLPVGEGEPEGGRPAGPEGAAAAAAAAAAADAEAAGPAAAAAAAVAAEAAAEAEVAVVPALDIEAARAFRERDTDIDRPASLDGHRGGPREASGGEPGHDPSSSGAGGSGGAGAALAAALAGLSAGGEPESDNSCVICYDGEASCVFLECGHGGFCRRCAFLLFVRPPNECPTCRTPIDQVVEIEPVVEVGQVARVK